MIGRHGARLLLLPVLALLAAPTGNVPLELPEPIGFPFTDSTVISRAIRSALARRSWLIQADDGHSVTAELRPRAHMARIRVDYNPREIRFAYLDSVALGYEEYEGGRYIHPHFNRWMRNLAMDIEVEVRRLQFERDPVDVVAPALPPAGPPALIRDLPPGTVRMEPGEAAPEPPVADASPDGPGPDWPVTAGQPATLRPGAVLRARPSAAGAAVPAPAPGTPVLPQAAVRNAEGRWWYVESGAISAWVLEGDLDPGS